MKTRKIQALLERHDTTKSTEFSLWKVTKNILKPICFQPPIRNSAKNWVKSVIPKAHTFANHHSKVFSPNAIMPFYDILQEINQVLAETIDSNTPIKRFSKYEVKSVINAFFFFLISLIPSGT